MSNNLNNTRVGIFYFGGGSMRFHSEKEFVAWASTKHELTLVGNALPVYIHDSPQTLEDIFTLVSAIEKQWEKLSGVIIYMASDDVIGVANIVTYLLGTVDKPVVFYNPDDGLHQYDPTTGTTLLNAVHLAKSDVASCVYLRGPHIFPVIHSFVNTKTGFIDCPENYTYGFIDFGTRLHENARTKFNQLQENMEHHSLHYNTIPRIHQSCSFNQKGMFAFSENLEKCDGQIVCEKHAGELDTHIPTLIVGDTLRLRCDQREETLEHLTPLAAIGKFIRSLTAMQLMHEEEEEEADREEEHHTEKKVEPAIVVEAEAVIDTEHQESSLTDAMNESVVNDEHEIIELEDEE